MAIQHEIPVIDISPFLSPSASQADKDAVVDSVRDACTTYGFFQLTGHGIPLELQNTMLDCARAFFALPQEKKDALSLKNAIGLSSRGYEIIGGQTLQTGMLPDLKEGFYLGREMSADDPRAGGFLAGPNQWPSVSDLPHDTFRGPIVDYYQRMLELDNVLLKILALGLPYGPDSFEEFKQDPTATVRLLHYPPQLSKDPKQLGAGAHTDFGCITLLLQQPHTTGLQVLYPKTGTWIPVPAVQDRYIVNVGDLLHRWTNGIYRSAVHRVLNVGGDDRYSVPFFYNGNLKHRLAPLDGSADDEAVTVEEHIKAKFSQSYAFKGK